MSDKICPGDYVEVRGNVGAVETNPDGSQKITLHPAEITRHVKRKPDHRVQKFPVPSWVHSSGSIYINTTLCTQNTSTIWTIQTYS